MVARHDGPSCAAVDLRGAPSPPPYPPFPSSPSPAAPQLWRQHRQVGRHPSHRHASLPLQRGEERPHQHCHRHRHCHPSKEVDARLVEAGQPFARQHGMCEYSVPLTAMHRWSERMTIMELHIHGLMLVCCVNHQCDDWMPSSRSILPSRRELLSSYPYYRVMSYHVILISFHGCTAEVTRLFLP